MRSSSQPDWAAEKVSYNQLFSIFGWPYDTTAAMVRLVFSGIFEKFPAIKFITHHLGGMVPYFSDRAIAHWDNGLQRLGADYFPGLTKHPIEYLKMFYADTAIERQQQLFARVRPGVLRRRPCAVRHRHALRRGKRRLSIQGGYQRHREDGPVRGRQRRRSTRAMRGGCCICKRAKDRCGRSLQARACETHGRTGKAKEARRQGRAFGLVLVLEEDIGGLPPLSEDRPVP